jgi:hypothetical protein
VTGILAEFESEIKGEVDDLFNDPELTVSITWKRYKGTTQVSGATYEDATLTALYVKSGLGSRLVQRDVFVEQGAEHFIIRTEDLPTGWTSRSLGMNDLIVLGSQTLNVTAIDRTLGFLVSVIGQGQ